MPVTEQGLMAFCTVFGTVTALLTLAAGFRTNSA
jgi:hypothetical protein